MGSTVELPLWLLILVVPLAAVATLDWIVSPGLRWFLRRRMERAVEELNKRLERPIRLPRLMRRQDQVIRLIYDSHVMEAVESYAREKGVPPNVAFAQAESYAREIVPGFSTATYFGFAIKVARRLSRGFYDVRLGRGVSPQLHSFDPRAAVVFVMNHRSNMDYVLVTWLAADRSALSYAVGEWAQIWPLKALIRGMGAYFIRRRYSNTLYRAVLARYVQMSIHEGVTQAMFPEGGLSVSGAVGTAKMGLLGYITRDFDQSSGRDVVFVPVALNYDQVLEDGVLVAAGASGSRRFSAPFTRGMGFGFRLLWSKLRGRFRGFGHAAVCYGEPLSLSAFSAGQTRPDTDALAAELMRRIGAAVPVLPVPLVAAALEQAGAPLLPEGVLAIARGMVERLEAAGANMHLPDGKVENAVAYGIEALRHRGLIAEAGGHLGPASGQEPLLRYYAASISQLLERAEPRAQPPAGQSDQLPGGQTARAPASGASLQIEASRELPSANET